MYFKKSKLLAVLMTLCMLFGMTDITVSAQEGSVFQDDNEEFASVNLMRMGNPVDNGIIYVGGTPSESPDGSSDAPFLTLKQAADAINSDADGGSYQIILQGNTTESETVFFGDGNAVYDITITNSVSGGAVQVSRAFTGFMIAVEKNAALTLQGCSETQELVFDGGGNTYQSDHSLLFVASGASLNMNDYTVIQNNISNNTLSVMGAGIYNLGTLFVNGGTIRNNTYAITALGTSTLSGNAYIPAGVDNNTIFLLVGRPILLSSGLQ